MFATVKNVATKAKQKSLDREDCSLISRGTVADDR